MTETFCDGVKLEFFSTVIISMFEGKGCLSFMENIYVVNNKQIRAIKRR